MSSDIVHGILAGHGINFDATQDAGEHLEQHGVKGMKWGVRRPRGTNGRVVARGSEDFVSSRKLKRKAQSELSNNELERLNRRLQLERTNRDLQSRGALQKIKAGTAIAGTILAVGTTMSTAYNFANSPAGKAIWSQIQKVKG